MLRCATRSDIPRISALIEASARQLSRGYYDERQIEAAIAHVFGVDTTLIDDATYVVDEDDGALRGCGGWSKRRTLFGGDQYTTRDAAFLDPAQDAARVRAFFVDPRAARCGIGRAILQHCEAAARAAGYRSAELMSTLPGVEFYRACGYIAGEPCMFTVGNGVAIEFVPMRKQLTA